MTYNVSGGTLNLAQSNPNLLQWQYFMKKYCGTFATRNVQ